jgi:hypothetical protein
MARNAHVFAIEDHLGISENLDAYAQVLAGMDAALSAALRPYLASIAAGHSVDTAAIWNALYAATASAD